MAHNKISFDLGKQLRSLHWPVTLPKSKQKHRYMKLSLASAEELVSQQSLARQTNMHMA